MVGLRKIIIAGGRDFNNYQFFLNNIWPLLKGSNQIEIVSGCANGADKIGEKFAESFGLPISRFPANWSKYGKSAGPIRNLEMAKYADELIAFWDGKSSGTKNMIDTATKLGLKINIFTYNIDTV
jgi:hypothetical protein